jgi:hypothetical protein
LIRYRIELSDRIVRPSFDGRFSIIARFMVLTGTLITRVVKGLNPTMPGGFTLSPIRPNVRLTPTWSGITVAQLVNRNIIAAIAVKWNLECFIIEYI